MKRYLTQKVQVETSFDMIFVWFNCVSYLVPLAQTFVFTATNNSSPIESTILLM